jgi:hypothetical protein
MFDIDPREWQECVNATRLENEESTRPFLEEEIMMALFQMEKNKAAGPDGLLVEFFQSCWDIIKEDVVDLFSDFHRGVLDVRKINYGIITLIPKVKEAERIQQFRHICLLNSLYKWITKCMTIRLEWLAESYISLRLLS